jgi:hypothetical protein
MAVWRESAHEALHAYAASVKNDARFAPLIRQIAELRNNLAHGTSETWNTPMVLEFMQGMGGLISQLFDEKK